MNNDNNNILDFMESSSTITETSVLNNSNNKTNPTKTTKKVNKKNTNKSVLKVKKFDFMVDPDLVDYLDNQIFITGIRDKKDYLNHLIRQDLKKRLNISDNQDLIDEWLKFKDIHVPKGLK